MLHSNSYRNLLIFGFKDDIRVKVADFGLAKHLPSNYKEYARLDKEALIAIRWTAVEVFNTQKVTQESDVWSFGMFSYPSI